MVAYNSNVGAFIMAKRLSHRVLSLDAVMAGTVLAACGWTIDQAYKEGVEPLEGQQPALNCACIGHHKSSTNNAGKELQKRTGMGGNDFVKATTKSSSSSSTKISSASPPASPALRLTPQLCRRLERDGYIVVDNFLTKQEITQAIASVASPTVRRAFNSSQNERNGDSVRTDKVCFFDREKGALTPEEEDLCETNADQSGLRRIQARLHRLSYDIATSTFQGFPGDHYKEDNRSANWLGVPNKMQVSIYDVINQGKGHSIQNTAATRPNKDTVGGYYRAHLDTCSDGVFEMGMIGYLKAHYLRRRYLTCIVYLNPSWQPSHGGCLRIFLNDNDTDCNSENRYVDVEPLEGRLVIFSSVSTKHAVLPSFAKRIACSVWLTLNE